MINNDINIKIIKYLSDEISDFEKEEFNNWLNSSDENKKYFEKIEKLWHSIKIPQPDSIPDFEAFWQELYSKMNNKQVPIVKENLFGYLKQKRLIKYFFNPGFAISTAIVVLISVIVINVFNEKVKPVSCYTHNAEKKTVILPDSSSVTLNSGSSLYYEAGNDTRFVRLKGEALFNIKKEKLAFEVHTFNAIIRVTGTRFNVKARNNKTSLVVENGTVLFSSIKRPEKKIKVTKNQMSECINKYIPTTPVLVRAEYLNGWINDVLIFNKTPLNELAEELSRHFNTKIIISELSLANMKVTGTFENQTLIEIINAVSKTVNCKYKKEDNTLFLYK